jgi:hypothetical protein
MAAEYPFPFSRLLPLLLETLSSAALRFRLRLRVPESRLRRLPLYPRRTRAMKTGKKGRHAVINLRVGSTAERNIETAFWTVRLCVLYW